MTDLIERGIEKFRSQLTDTVGGLLELTTIIGHDELNEVVWILMTG